MCDNEKNELEAKLKMNNEYVCELYDKSQAQTETKCNWHNEGNKFVFTLMKPEAFLKNTFTCVISKIKPLPIETKEGPSIKLLRGCRTTLAPQKKSCSFPNQTHNQNHTAVERPILEDKYVLLFCGLIITLAMLTLYSIILTACYIRLRDKNMESSDTLTYVPMQRNVNRHDLDNTEYVDMREVQKRGGSHRDMNHNSRLAF
ncbi:Hydroxylysine kinase [Labeo rohita]|uniref:Hydroxylysine kinase n=2 Tax=Labeo rohita TaxID=84645 RepID=A0ABQ8ME95_LABRO|nr:Hydroxylysine kinase [Labeo rohita]